MIQNGDEGVSRKYLLHPDCRLRGWKGDPFYLETFPERTLRRLRPAEFAFLLKCDGETEILPGTWPPEPSWVKPEGVVIPAQKGGTLLPEQEYFCYPNRKLTIVHLSLTGRCNCNCKHCFNALDCNPRTVEPTLEQLISLLDQIEACGVNRLRLDGGEPLLRKDFLDFTAEMAKRKIRAAQIVTNGLCITSELLDALEEQGHDPEWFISFDGLGHHDWMRGVQHAEEQVLDRISLLCRRGYYVNVLQCLWRDSLDTVSETIEKLQELGVSRYRIITVEPSLRWRQTAPEQTISTEEWLSFLPGFLEWWYSNRISMDLDVWGYWIHNRKENRVRIVPDLFSAGESDRLPLCPINRNRPFIDADGRLVHCMALSGGSPAFGLIWGNVYHGDHLQELFTNSAYLHEMEYTKGQFKETHEECRSCPWRDRCSIGCRAEAVAQCGDLHGLDRRVCLFYRDGYYDRLLQIARKYELNTHD